MDGVARRAVLVEMHDQLVAGVLLDQLARREMVLEVDDHLALVSSPKSHIRYARRRATERAMSDERLCNPISTGELERRWAAVRAAMPEQKLDALIIQGANNLAGTGGYFRWFTGVSMGTSYPATVIFPRDGLMTLVSHGPMGAERDFAGKDPVWRGVGKWLPTASFPAIDYCIPYDPELIA